VGVFRKARSCAQSSRNLLRTQESVVAANVFKFQNAMTQCMKLNEGHDLFGAELRVVSVLGQNLDPICLSFMILAKNS
jgi:hypothetical protein